MGKDRLQHTIYSRYITQTAPVEEDLLLMERRLSTFEDPPTISVLLVISDPDEIWVKASVSSVLSGVYPHVELCICDNASERPHVRETLAGYAASDGRVKVHRLTTRVGAAEAFNALLPLATGQFISLLGEGDTLAPETLFRVVDLLQNIEADAVYADEDLVDISDRRTDPTFKPFWSPDLLLSTLYIGRPWVIRSRMVRNLRGLREQFGAAAELDLWLKVTEKTDRVHHLPGVGYHRRVYRTSPLPPESDQQEAAQRAVRRALERRAVEATLEPGPEPNSLHVIRSVYGQPTVSLVALTTGAAYANRIHELERSTTFPLHEVLPVVAGAGVVPGRQSKTPAEAANLAAAKSTGEYLLFLRDYEEASTTEWLGELLRQAQRTEVGAVGGKIIDGKGNARCAGSFLVDLSRLAGSPMIAFPRDERAGLLPVPDLPLNPYAVSADCMMVRRSVFEEAGGFDDQLPMAFYDLDFSFRLIEKGLMNVYAPRAAVVSRTNRPLPDAREIQLMWERWWPMLVKTLYYRDSPLRTKERTLDGNLLSLVSAPVQFAGHLEA